MVFPCRAAGGLTSPIDYRSLFALVCFARVLAAKRRTGNKTTMTLFQPTAKTCPTRSMSHFDSWGGILSNRVQLCL